MVPPVPGPVPVPHPCSEVSVNSPGNLWSQSGRRKGRLGWEGFAEKESFKSVVEE